MRIAGLIMPWSRREPAMLRDGPASRRAARSWRWGGAGLVLLCLSVYVPGLFAIPPVDRDESRFAMASWQMYTSGDWVVPRIQDRARLNKPPLIYWLQAGAWAVLGSEKWENGGIWVFRLPSVFAAITTVLLTWRMGLRMFDPRAAWLGAALLAVCPMVVWDAHQARADQVLLTTVVAAQSALWVVWGRGGIVGEKKDRPLIAPLCFWLAIGAGIMMKGPIAPMIAGLTCLALCIVSRRWGWLLRLRPVLGVVVVGAMVGPWVWLVGERVGWSEYLRIVYDETIGRSTAPKEGHWGPPGYHTVLLGILFWPGSLLTAVGIVRAFRRGLMGRWLHARPARPAELFSLAWIVPAWIVFELIGTKLPHYTMPMYPAIALLSARALMAAQSGRGRAFQRPDRETVVAHLARNNASCPRCRYQMHAMKTPRCPECGLVVTLNRKGRLVDLDRPERGSALGAILWLLIGAALTVAIPCAFVNWTAIPVDPATVCGAALILSGLFFLAGMYRALRHRAVLSATFIAIVSLIVTYAGLFPVLLPSLKAIWISPRVVQAMVRIDPSGQLPMGDMAFREDSLVFLTRGRVVRLSSESETTQWIKAHPSSILILSGSTPLYSVIGATGQYDGVSWRCISTESVTGFDYSTGRHVSLSVVGVSP